MRQGTRAAQIYCSLNVPLGTCLLLQLGFTPYDMTHSGFLALEMLDNKFVLFEFTPLMAIFYSNLIK